MKTPEKYIFRRATEADTEAVVRMIAGAQRRLAERGIDQWQNGYPNREAIRRDVAAGYGRVIEVAGRVVAYGALTYDGEAAYDGLEGKGWLTPLGAHYATVHRLMCAEEAVGRGYGRLFMCEAEREAATRVASLRVDTHPDNRIMQSLIGSLGYTYCGTVCYESPRLAYEKMLG